MSGGFFRGTTADQDTRFSNKQAKLLKTQKFPAELEHLVDVSKVKMDVIKPWIAKRVTEFLGGFEDEVLINFIYGLLEGKEINGKAIQIQLTGFMEKNTGKFMKELWALLLSAQNNASGVPQQFLDAKEEETRKKKVETDRITNEIQKRKDKETEQEKKSKMDGGLANSSAEESIRKREGDRDSPSGVENGADVRNGVRGRNRSPRFPNPSDRSPSPHRSLRPRSVSKSYTNSRSRSIGSVSKSISPGPRRRSVSPQRSVSPRKPTARGSVSPKWRSHSRSLSRSRRRSPSPVRRRFRSPPRRRSPSPFRHRPRSPLRRRSPFRRRRSPSPWRRRSPSIRRRRSPSPIRQRRRRSTSSPRPQSPVQRRQSPFPRRRRSTSSPRSQSPTVHRHYQSPAKRRSPHPLRHRSPCPDRRGSPLPRRPRTPSPVRRRSPSPVRRSSPFRVRRRSPARSPRRSVSSDSRSSPSPVRDSFSSPIKMKSPGRHGSPREKTRLNDRAEPVMVSRRQSMVMSPQRDHSDASRSRRKVPSQPPSPEKSQSYIDSPKQKTRTSIDDRSSYGSSHKRAEDQSCQHSNKEGYKNSRAGEQRTHKSMERRSDQSYGANKKKILDEPPSRSRDPIELRRNRTEMASLEVTPEKVNAAKKSPYRGSVPGDKQVTLHTHDASKSDEKRSSLSKDHGYNTKPGVLVNPSKKGRSPSVSSDSGSEGNDVLKNEVTKKRKHRRSSRRELASDESSSESEIEDRKEAKRRKKEEKKFRKEERHRRRDERRCRREEKRASKRLRKDADSDVLSPDLKRNEQIEKGSNGERMGGKYSSEEEEAESQKKKLEIELRKKALESLRAKKGIRH